MIIRKIEETINQEIPKINSQLEQKANNFDLNTLKTRMDTFTQLAEGSTTGDAELIDGRIDFEGKVYANIGDAIREQSKDSFEIANKIEKSLNIFQYTEQKGFLYVDKSTNTMKYSAEESYKSKTTKKIKCSMGDTFLYKGVGRSNAYSWVFFKDEKIIDCGQYEGETIVIIPSEVNYVLFSSFSGISNDIVLDVEYKNNTKDLFTDNIEDIRSDIKDLYIFSESVQKETNSYVYSQQDGYLCLNNENKLFQQDTENYHSITTKPIRCREGEQFEYLGVSRNFAIGWAFLDSKHNVLSYGVNNSNSIEGEKVVVTMPKNCSYVIFSSFALKKNPLILEISNLNNKLSFSNRLADKVEKLKNKLDDSIAFQYGNLFNKEKIEIGYINNNGDLVSSSTGYRTTQEFIYFNKGKSYTISPRVRIIAKYSLDKNLIEIDNIAKTEPYTITTDSDYLFKFSLYAEDVDKFIIEEGDTTTRYKPYGLVLKNEIGFNDAHKDYIESRVNKNGYNNVLYGKKLVACGDSFTQGDFTGFVDENGLSGKNSPVLYDSVRGMYKTYPWWIAERNNMQLVNEAISGSTLTAGLSKPFSETRYQNLPKDADYILIKIGINDDSSHQKATLGTIDDVTNTTFYGAWNVVLEYLITNHPWAKIGIIITNGCTESYCNAIRECARKWGIPYLDEANGDNVPLLNRTVKSYVCEKAKNLRNEQMRVSATNTHPNIKAHEYESTIVENFLRSL